MNDRTPRIFLCFHCISIVLHGFSEVLTRHIIAHSPPVSRPGRKHPRNEVIMRLSERARSLHFSPIREIAELANPLGDRVVRLDIGEPDFPEPEVLQHVMPEIVRRGSSYAPAAGMPHLRELLADRQRRLFDDPIEARDIVVTAGATGALNAAMALLADAGDTIAIPSPGFPNYRGFAAITGIRTVPYHLRPEDDWQPDLDEVGTLLDAGARAVIVNTPLNPAGSVITASTMRALADLARDHDAWLVSDEVYAAMQFEGEPVSGHAIAPDRVISISAMSKEFSMTGWRVGWAVVPDVLAERFPMMSMGLSGSPASISEEAAAAVLDTPTDAMRAFYRERQLRTTGWLAELGLESWRPEGTFYRLVRLPEHITDSRAFAHELVTEHGVATVPGIAFGDIPGVGTGYLRLSLTRPDDRIRLGLERIAHATGSR